MKNGDFTCTCGCKYKMVPQGDSKTYTTQMTSLAPAHAPPKAPSVDRARDVDVLVPLFVSLITGGLLAAFMLVMDATVKWSVGSGICLTSIIWAIILLIFVLSRAGLIQGLVWAIEDYFGVDVDGDGHEGEPDPPGRTLINGAPRRPRRWQNLDAGIKREDLVEFARHAYELQEAGMGTGQRAFRKMGLPSRFKCNDKIHATLVCDLVDAGLAHYSGSGFELVQFDSVQALLGEVRQRVTVGR